MDKTTQQAAQVDLAAAEERAKAATPGPWKATTYADSPSMGKFRRQSVVIVEDAVLVGYGAGPLRSLAEEWTARKCRDGGLWAKPRLLVTYADPAVGHDGATYLAAGATACGAGTGGKLLFAWALDEDLRKPLADLELELRRIG